MAVTLLPAAMVWGDVGANHSSHNASFLPSFELPGGSYSADDVIIAKEGTNVSLECLLTMDQYGDVHWYNSKGRQLHSTGNPLSCGEPGDSTLLWGVRTCRARILQDKMSRGLLQRGLEMQFSG